MPILSQTQIEAETRSKWGGTTNRISQELLKRSLADFEDFIKGAFSLFPEMAQFENVKGITTIDTPCDHSQHCHHDHSDVSKAFSPQKITALERKFRDLFGNSKAVDLLNMAQRWVMAAFFSEEVGRGGYWANAYFQLVDHQLRATFDQVRSTWERLSPRLRQQIAPPIPIVVDNSTDFLMDIYKNGYELVTSKITKLHLPQIQQIMVDGMTNGKTWQEIAAEMNQLGGAEAYHWTRLVRSEMINASQQAAIEEARASEGVNLRWITSISKTTCKVCLERNGKIFDPHKMGLTDYFKSGETAKIKVPVGRYPHPQCRCSLSPTYLKPTWQ